MRWPKPWGAYAVGAGECRRNTKANPAGQAIVGRAERSAFAGFQPLHGTGGRNQIAYDGRYAAADDGNGKRAGAGGG